MSASHLRRRASCQRHLRHFSVVFVRFTENARYFQSRLSATLSSRHAVHEAHLLLVRSNSGGVIPSAANGAGVPEDPIRSRIRCSSPRGRAQLPEPPRNHGRTSPLRSTPFLRRRIDRVRLERHRRDAREAVRREQIGERRALKVRGRRDSVESTLIQAHVQRRPVRLAGVSNTMPSDRFFDFSGLSSLAPTSGAVGSIPPICRMRSGAPFTKEMPLDTCCTTACRGSARENRKVP